MDPNNNNPQTGNQNLDKLEQDLEKLTKEAGATAQPASKVPVQPVQPLTPQPIEVSLTPMTEPTPSLSQPIDTPPAPPNVSVEGGKKGSSLMAIAMTLLIIAVVVAVGYVAYTKFMIPTATPTPVPVVTEMPSPEITPQASDSGVPSTANWKTYINNYWGISFKYPDTLFKPCSNYVVNEKDGIQFWEKDFICPDAHDIPYKIGFFGYDPDIYTKEKQPSSTETIIVNGRQAQKKTYIYTADDGQSFGWKQSVRIVFTLSNGTIVLQQIGDNLDEQKAFNQILSTFQFTSSTPSATPQ